MKALTVTQPWAWLLIHGTKDIENRNWPTSFRGEIAIHAAKGMPRGEYADAKDFVEHIDPGLAACMPEPAELVRGAVIGTMVLRKCVTAHPSPWFTGPYGFVMDTPQPCDPIQARGGLGFWSWEPDEPKIHITECERDLVLRACDTFINSPERSRLELRQAIVDDLERRFEQKAEEPRNG